MKRKLHVYDVSAPVSELRETSVHLASVVDHEAEETRVLKRIFSSIRCSRTVSRRYCMIEGPSAIDFSCVQGLNEKPSVCMSLSDRTPG